MSYIEMNNISFTYQKGMPDEKQAVHNVNLNIDEGQFVGIIGHTGSGKSTLIQMLNGLLKPTTGDIKIDGKNIWSSPEQILKTRFIVGLVMQYPEYQLFEETVYKDIAFGPKNMGLSEEEIDQRIKETCSYLNIPDKVLNSSPFDLSGGQKRRVAIAGILAMRPKILVLDEPTAGLDPRGRRELLDLIKNYHEKEKNIVIFVSHSMDDVAIYSDKVLVMNQGEVFCFEEVDNVFSKADLLQKMGLNIPGVTEILLQLKNKGYNIETSIYDVETAADYIYEKYKKGIIKCEISH